MPLSQGYFTVDSLAANTYSRRILLFLALKNSNGNLNTTAYA